MVKVYGASDDLVEIENSQYKQDEIDCFDSDVCIRFVDGTVIRLGYPKKQVRGIYSYCSDCIENFWNEEIYDNNAFKKFKLDFFF